MMLQLNDLPAFQRKFARAFEKPSVALPIGAFFDKKYGANWEGDMARRALQEARTLFLEHQNQPGWRRLNAFYKRRPVATQWRAAKL